MLNDVHPMIEKYPLDQVAAYEGMHSGKAASVSSLLWLTDKLRVERAAPDSFTAIFII